MTPTPETPETNLIPRSLFRLEAEDAPDWRRADRANELPLQELYYELKPLVEAAGNGEGLDYFSPMVRYDDVAYKGWGRPPRPIPVLTEQTRLKDVRYKWIAVFPVTGGSEGHYVHVDLLWQREHQEGRIPLFLAKTFGGHKEAIKLAALLARLLGV